MSRPLILIVDNHDSFTYNLAQYLREIGSRVEVHLNDAITPGQILESGCDGIVVSPGPGRPAQAGNTPAIVRAAAGRLPLLGVCLGHQAIGEAWGARVVRAPRIMHGKTSQVRHDGRGIFAGLPSPIEVGRYHSLVVDPDSVPADLEVSAVTDEGDDLVIMGLRHRDFPRTHIEGVQFHPESILTVAGKRMMATFVEQARAARAGAA